MADPQRLTHEPPEDLFAGVPLRPLAPEVLAEIADAQRFCEDVAAGRATLDADPDAVALSLARPRQLDPDDDDDG